MKTIQELKLNKAGKILATMMVLAMAFAMTGCSDDDDNPTGMNVNNLGDGAMLRVVHASPDAPAVDIYAEGVATPLVENLKYLETTPYLELDPGDYNIQIRGAGADPATDPVYETGMLTIPEGATITAAALGLLAGMDQDNMFRVVPLVENFTDPGAGNAAVRIIHGSADAPSVAIDVGNDGTPEISDFARFDDTGAAGVALPSGQNLNVGIWAGSPLGRVTAFTTPALGDDEYLLIATGLLSKAANDPMGFGLLAVGPMGTIGLIKQDPVVYVLHTSPDAPAVDVYVGGSQTELIDNLSFGDLSSPVQVPPATYTLDVRVWDGGAVAATVATPELEAGERYLAIASGFAGGANAGLTLLPYRDEFGAPGSPLLRVVHASPDAPAVDVGLVEDKAFTAVNDFKNLAFGQSSMGDGTAIPAANLTVGVAAAGGDTPVATFDLAIGANLRAFAVAAGSLAGQGESFRLLVVDTAASPWQVAEVNPND